ncbi:hypothetical protein EYF80_054352 [Liparis tanakae]|uniref:Uncharacterized protein n=1 Tax=Liparis tanakae TaxID=230148 RepID=A0A4Z2F3Y4_9TELE|nr:hypothetical protein EYF80_054352 [Liparis tanakae]
MHGCVLFLESRHNSTLRPATRSETTSSTPPKHVRGAVNTSPGPWSNPERGAPAVPSGHQHLQDLQVTEPGREEQSVHAKLRTTKTKKCSETVKDVKDVKDDLARLMALVVSGTVVADCNQLNATGDEKKDVAGRLQLIHGLGQQILGLALLVTSSLQLGHSAQELPRLLHLERHFGLKFHEVVTTGDSAGMLSRLNAD